MNILEFYKSNSSVIVSSYDGLNIVRYKHPSVDWSNPLIRGARGLVISDDGEVVARPFDKFFNLNELVGREDYGEEVQELSRADQGDIEVTDKLDGSLVIAFYSGGLKFASSGSLCGPHVGIFESVVNKLWTTETYDKVEKLSKTYTLLFEYTSPDNRVVLDYSCDKVRLIGLRHTANGKEYTMEESKSITEGIGIDYVDVLPLHSMGEVNNYIDRAEGVEGVVVLFIESMKRVKMKTEDYLCNHGRLSELRLNVDRLTKSNENFIEMHMFSNEEGYLDDLLSRYRGLKMFESTLTMIDDMKLAIGKFISDVNYIADNYDECCNAIDGINRKDLVYSCSLLEGSDVPVNLIFRIKTKLNNFHAAQEDYQSIKLAINATRYKELMSIVDERLKYVSKYPNKVSAKSYIYQVLDYKDVWNDIRHLGLY